MHPFDFSFEFVKILTFLPEFTLEDCTLQIGVFFDKLK